MGFLVPRPATKKDLWSAGLNGDGRFIIGNEYGDVVFVPEEWMAPLAAELLWERGILKIWAIRFLGQLRVRLRRLNVKNRWTETLNALDQLADLLEGLVQEKLEAQPETSTRPEWRPPPTWVTPPRPRATVPDLDPRMQFEIEPAPWE